MAGEYPGNGRSKPVAFPNPAAVAERSEEGIWFLSLKSLIELKLASAKSAPHRIKDRADVLGDDPYSLAGRGLRGPA